MLGLYNSDGDLVVKYAYDLNSSIAKLVLSKKSGKSDLLMDKLKINATNLKCNNIRIVDDDNDDEYFKDFS